MYKNHLVKIAYVNFLPSGGQYKRLVSQAKASKSLGLDIEYIVITDEEYNPAERISVFHIRWPRNILLKKFSRSFLRYRKILKTVDLKTYDKIVMRYIGAWDLSYRKFVKKYKNKLILEHHSIVQDELRVVEKGLLNSVRIKLEQFQAPKIMSFCAGIIGVTDEIRKKILEYSPDKPSTVISNGIDVKSIEFTQFRPFNGHTLDIIFVSSTFYSYQGLDRLLSGLLEYNGDIFVNLYIVGDVYLRRELDMISSIQKKNVCIHILGEIYGPELDQSFRKSNVAVSTLALHRKHLKQACSLKTREYLARGIPFAYAYEDVDLEKDCTFTLKYDDDENPVDIQKMIDFTARVSKMEGLSDRMREYALNRIDWKINVRKMVDFLAGLPDKQ